MLTKVAFGMAVVLATVSGSLAATHTYVASTNQTVYNPAGAYVGADTGIRFGLSRDADRARANWPR